MDAKLYPSLNSNSINCNLSLNSSTINKMGVFLENRKIYFGFTSYVRIKQDPCYCADSVHTNKRNKKLLTAKRNEIKYNENNMFSTLFAHTHSHAHRVRQSSRMSCM